MHTAVQRRAPTKFYWRSCHFYRRVDWLCIFAPTNATPATFSMPDDRCQTQMN